MNQPRNRRARTTKKLHSFHSPRTSTTCRGSIDMLVPSITTRAPKNVTTTTTTTTTATMVRELDTSRQPQRNICARPLNKQSTRLAPPPPPLSVQYSLRERHAHTSRHFSTLFDGVRQHPHEPLRQIPTKKPSQHRLRHLPKKRGGGQHIRVRCVVSGAEGYIYMYFFFRQLSRTAIVALLVIKKIYLVLIYNKYNT